MWALGFERALREDNIASREDFGAHLNNVFCIKYAKKSSQIFWNN